MWSQHYLLLDLALPLNRFSFLLWLNTPGMRWFVHERFSRSQPRLCLLKMFTTRLLRNDHRILRKWEFLGQTGCLLNLGSSSYFWIEHLSVSFENCSVFGCNCTVHQSAKWCCPLPPPPAINGGWVVRGAIAGCVGGGAVLRWVLHLLPKIRLFSLLLLQTE